MTCACRRRCSVSPCVLSAASKRCRSSSCSWERSYGAVQDAGPKFTTSPHPPQGWGAQDPLEPPPKPPCSQPGAEPEGHRVGSAPPAAPGSAPRSAPAAPSPPAPHPKTNPIRTLWGHPAPLWSLPAPYIPTPLPQDPPTCAAASSSSCSRLFCSCSSRISCSASALGVVQVWGGVPRLSGTPDPPFLQLPSTSGCCSAHLFPPGAAAGLGENKSKRFNQTQPNVSVPPPQESPPPPFTSHPFSSAHPSAAKKTNHQ